MKLNVKEKLRNADWKQVWFTCFCVLFGNAVLAFGIAAFLIPHGIISDGTTGIGIVLNKTFPNFDTAWLILALNIILLLLGLVILGKKFFVTTVAGSILYPLFLEAIQQIPGIENLTENATLAAIMAGILCGIGLGLPMRVGSSTGGMDILALVFHRWFHIPISVGIYIFGFLVIGGQAIFSAPEKTILGVLLLIIETLLIEQIMLLGRAKVQIFAVSDKHEEIRQMLLNDLKFGVTMTAIETGHLEKKEQGVLCILSSRKLHETIERIRKVDPDAFVTVTKIREVHGRGYRED